MRCITDLNYDLYLLGCGQTRYDAGVFRFAYSSTMAQVTAFRLPCVVEATRCFSLQVNMRIWTPHHIKENYSYHSLICLSVQTQSQHSLSLCKIYYKKIFEKNWRKCRDELVKKVWRQGRNVVCSRTTTIMSNIHKPHLHTSLHVVCNLLYWTSVWVHSQC